MEAQLVQDIAVRRGVVPQAMEAIIATVQAHFAGSSPPPAAVEAYIAALPVWDKLGMDYATFAGMPVTWRHAQGQALQAPRAGSRRPTTRALTPGELAELDRLGLDRYTRIEKARVLQQSPPPPQGG